MLIGEPILTVYSSVCCVKVKHTSAAESLDMVSGATPLSICTPTPGVKKPNRHNKEAWSKPEIPGKFYLL